jgi:hypothetical protein
MGKASHYSSAKKQGDEVNDDKGEGRSHGFKRAEGCDNWREKIVCGFRKIQRQTIQDLKPTVKQLTLLHEQGTRLD